MRKTQCLWAIALLFRFANILSATEGERMKNQTLRYWFWYLPTTLDTCKADRAGVMAIAKNIYAPLVSTFLDSRPQGMVAESWAVDNAGKEWRFKIRKGLVFDDGTPITADIVLQNFRRILWFTRGDGLLLNSLMPEISKWGKYGDALDCLHVDKDTIVFKFNRRPLNLFEEISMPIYGIANPKCFDEAGQWKESYCASASGQYKIKEMTADKVVLESRHVFAEAEHAPDIVEVRARTDRNTAVEILNGNGDLTVLPGFDVPDEALAKARRSELRLTAEPTARMHFMQLNADKPPFNDKTLRQSIRDTFLDLLGGNAVFTAETELDPSFIPKGGVGYVSLKISKRIKIRKMPGREIIILLQPLSVQPSNKGQKIQKAVEETILQTLKLHGMKPQIIRCDGGELIERRRRNKFDVLFRFSGVSIDDPYAALRMMFMSDIGAQIPDPSHKIPGLIERAESTEDPETRKLTAEEINKSMFDESSVVTYAHSSLVYIHTNRVDLSRFNLFSDPIEFRAVNWRPEK